MIKEREKKLRSQNDDLLIKTETETNTLTETTVSLATGQNKEDKYEGVSPFFTAVGRFFSFERLKTNFRQELLGGSVTAFAMIYILAVNPGIMMNAHSITGGKIDAGGLFLGTLVITVISCVVMGMVGNLPTGLSTGMGFNTFIVFNVANQGIGFEGAMIAVMISSVLFCIFSCFKIRYIFIRSISPDLQKVIAVAIGFFIAYTGLKNTGIFNLDPNTSLPTTNVTMWQQNYPIILVSFALLGVLLFFHAKKFKFGIICTIGVGLVISLILGNVTNNDFLNTHFSHWTGWSYGTEFSGFQGNISSVYNHFTDSAIWSSPTFYVAIVILVFLYFFSGTASFFAVEKEIASHPETRNFKINQRAFVGDSFGNLASGFIGISPITPFIESVSGVSNGARTGFSNLMIAGIFLLALPLYPLIRLISTAQVILAPVLVYVGILSMRILRELDFRLDEVIVSSFLVIIGILVTYNILIGMGIGFFFYTLTCWYHKKFDKLNWAFYCLDVVFIVYFVLFTLYGQHG